MATLDKKVTRVKRDYPEFRERLKNVLHSKDMTQTDAAKLVGMDARTFNHVVSGPVHPDLMLIREIGNKLDINLNYLFGLSQQTDKAPDSVNSRDYVEARIYSASDGDEELRFLTTISMNKNFLCGNTSFKDAEAREAEFFYVRVSNTDCDALISEGVTAGVVAQETVSKKGVYLIKTNNRMYFRWAEVRFGDEDITVSTDVLGKDAVKVSPDKVEVIAMMTWKGADF